MCPHSKENRLDHRFEEEAKPLGALIEPQWVGKLLAVAKEADRKRGARTDAKEPQDVSVSRE